MAFEPDQPFPKFPGDEIKSRDWNDLVAEVKRLGEQLADLDRRKKLVKSLAFNPAPYWSGNADDYVNGFALSLEVPGPGLAIARMSALVRMKTAGKAIYIGPELGGSITYANRGGLRVKDATSPEWIGTAAFNTKQVGAGTIEAKVHASIDSGVAQIAWGFLLVEFVPD
jgi:hypothetical protein